MNNSHCEEIILPIRHSATVSSQRLSEYGRSDDRQESEGVNCILGLFVFRPLFGRTIPPAPDATMQGRNSKLSRNHARGKRTRTLLGEAGSRQRPSKGSDRERSDLGEFIGLSVNLMSDRKVQFLPANGSPIPARDGRGVGTARVGRSTEEGRK